MILVEFPCFPFNFTMEVQHCPITLDQSPTTSCIYSIPGVSVSKKDKKIRKNGNSSNTVGSFKILRETIFGEFRSCRIAIFALLVALNFVDLVNFGLQKGQKSIKNQVSEPINVLKWQVLHFQNLKN